MVTQQTSRMRWAAVASAVVSTTVVLALIPLKTRGFVCGWTHEVLYREAGGEGETGNSYWIGSAPRRFMLVATRFDTGYPNDLPLGAPREVTHRTRHFCREERPAQGFADWASPTTYPTRYGFGFMNRRVELSSHTREHVRALILPHWLVLVLATVPTGMFSLRLIRRGRCTSRGECAACGYDLRATPERCPECGTAVGSCLGGVGN